MYTDFYKNKSALVAGGAGFLGTHLVEALLRLGCTVMCVDNLYTGSLKNIEEFKNNSRFRFIEADIADSFTYDENLDLVFNLACPASPIHYQKDPIFTTKTNVLGMLNLLDIAQNTKARIFQASTSEVYGDPAVHPQKESYWGNVNPIGIRACYDEGKRCAETLCFDYMRQYGLELRVARIFNTYGPNMDIGDGRVVSNFIVQALQGCDITIYGDGEQTRSFCYVTDLINGFLKLVAADNIHEPINLGNPVEFSIKELADLVIKKTNSTSRLIYKDLPKDDPKVRQPDITLAQKKLKWFPNITLEEGLEPSIRFFREALELKKIK